MRFVCIFQAGEDNEKPDNPFGIMRTRLKIRIAG